MKRILGITLTLLAFTFQVNAQAYVDLSYHFNNGEQFELEQKSRNETYMTVNDIQQRTTRDYNNIIVIDVKEVSPGKATLNFYYKELKFNWNAKNTNIAVDANGPASTEPFQKGLKFILKKPFTVEINSFGIISKIEGLNELLDSAETAFNDLKKDEQAAYKKLMTDQFGTEAFRSWLEQLLVMYPAHGIKTGTQWEENVPMRGGLVGSIDLYWNLQTWDAQTAKIGGTAKIKTDKVQMLELEDGIKATAEISGATQSNYLISRSSGFPSICVQTTELNGAYTYKANKAKGFKKDINVPVKVITNASYKIKQMK
ncbi:DUF6263 family protein [Chitinophaga sp. Hz27]|uniref:DUF6263 family protein n=1 Tax=Chitinophaga sp. Hz27 TaxID=3347169 RepID=UPI0035E1556E